MKEDSIHIVNLSNYVTPEIKEKMGQDWVMYGEKNKYYDYLLDRSRGSATNGAIINSITMLIYGEGLRSNQASLKPDEWARVVSLFNEEDLRRLISDLKRTGNAALMVTYKGNHKSINTVSHWPIETLAAEKIKEGKQQPEAYYYHPDWKKYKKDEVVRYPAFGTSTEASEILFIKPYMSGLYYYSTPDNQGGLQWAELEEEIANYHVNNVKNAFAPSMLINFNNGQADSEEKRKEVVKAVRSKYEGSSNSGKVIISFNQNAEAAATIEAVQLSNASEQYQFLSDECMRKILVSHRVTSPLLLGISTNTGFGSNADELKVASVLFDTLVLEPFRKLIIDALNKILAFDKIAIPIYFESLNPFMDEVEEKPVEMNKHIDFDDEAMFNELEKYGEEEDLENWELIDEREVNYEEEEALDQRIEFANTGIAIPNAKSEQDGENSEGDKYKVRYQYNPLKAGSNSREFCKKMVAAAKIYRKEDIIRMGENPTVNPGWGLGGANTYSIWLYKGGGGCHHRWVRKTYKQREGARNVDVNNPNAETVSTSEAKRQGFTPETNDIKVAVKPVNMPNKGFVNK